MVKIVGTNAAVLRKKAQEVPLEDISTEKIRTVLKNMSEALAGEYDGVALAAPQINTSLRIFVVSQKVFAPDDELQEDMVFINPVIKKMSKEKEAMEEGCLSVRYKYGEVKRSTKVTVQAYDKEGKLFTYNATGLLAQIFQHETDHLDGILFTDKAKNVRDIDPEELRAHHEGS